MHHKRTKAKAIVVTQKMRREAELRLFKAGTALLLLSLLLIGAGRLIGP